AAHVGRGSGPDRPVSRWRPSRQRPDTLCRFRTAPAKAKARRDVSRAGGYGMMRHALATRIWHWANLVCLVVLFMSGLNIFNAHPRLYWGEWGFAPADAWLILPRFPGWMTIPGYYSLASARDWHIVFSWIFALGLLIFMIASLVNHHFRRDLVTSPKDWKPSAIAADI